VSSKKTLSNGGKMVEILAYAITQDINSSRKIEKALHYDISVSDICPATNSPTTGPFQSFAAAIPKPWVTSLFKVPK
jgi:transposase